MASRKTRRVPYTQTAAASRRSQRSSQKRSQELRNDKLNETEEKVYENSHGERLNGIPKNNYLIPMGRQA